MISSDPASGLSHVFSVYYPCLVLGISFLAVVVAFGTRNIFAIFMVAVIEPGRASRQSLYPTIAVDLFHGKAFGAIIGAGAGIGPRLGGMIHDWTGELIFAFSARAGADVKSVVFIWIVGLRRSR